MVCMSIVSAERINSSSILEQKPPIVLLFSVAVFYLKDVLTLSLTNSRFGTLISCVESKNIPGCCRGRKRRGGRGGEEGFPRRSIASLTGCQKYWCVHSFFFLPSYSPCVFLLGLKSSVWNYISVRYIELQSGMKAAVPPKKLWMCVCSSKCFHCTRVCLSFCFLAPYSCRVCVCVCVRDFPVNCSI